jgi:SAM-dependent methyltransferase
VSEPVPAHWDGDVLSRYEGALWGGRPLRVRDAAGGTLPFDVNRWLREPDAADETMLACCDGPTLDVGCGPGRLIAALAGRGVPALGVDVAGAAVAIARSFGALALCRSIYDRVPGAGRWQVALLADGNIGIGGDPLRLLHRLFDLLSPGGRAIVEVEGHDDISEFTATVVGSDGRTVASFPWARLGALPLIDLAVPVGYRVVDRWECADRHFVQLRKR